MLWYTPTLDKDCPPWVYASWAVGLFLYQTFDAVDGSQARRTHQSGPLGELFDHGMEIVTGHGGGSRADMDRRRCGEYYTGSSALLGNDEPWTRLEDGTDPFCM
jgi:hypothetical protein